MITQPGRFTRTGIRRSGDDYQDLCALEFLVEMLEHPKRYQWVRVEADGVGVLDDVLALREDEGYVARQVKYAGHPEGDSDAWTWDKLLVEREGNGKRVPSLLFRWFSSWQQLRARGTVAEASLESNRKAGDGLRDIIDPNGIIPFDRIPPETREKILRQFGHEGDTRAFFSGFRFRLDRPGLEVLEEGLSRRFYALGGTREGWLSLKEQLRLWVRERYEPPPDGSITIAVVRAAANWYGLRGLPEDFEVPGDYTLPSRSFHDNFLRAVVQRARGCEVLVAPPALGKSTYLSYLVRQLREANVPVVRHHYFLRIGEPSQGRLDHSRIAEALMSELQTLYPDSLGHLSPRNPDPEELGAWVKQAGSHFNAQGRILVVVIDGLDHVWRERDSREELVQLFEHLLPSPDGVVVVVGTQPVDEAQLPPSLLRECPRDQWIQLEPLDQDAVAAWLQRHEDELDLPPEPMARQNVLSQLAPAFYSKSGGHPLHLRFILNSVLDRGQGVSAQAVSDLPGGPGKDIMAYYSDLWNSLPEDGRRVLHLLACTNFPWPSSGVVEALDPRGVDIVTVHSAFRQVRHLLTDTPLGLRPFHSSLLVFVRSQASHSTYAGAMRASARQWLTTTAPDYWRWGYSWLLDAEDGQSNALIDGPSRAWIIDSLLRGYPRHQISDILGRSAWSALEKGHLGRFVEVALLRDNLEWQEHQALLGVQLALGWDVRLGDISLANLDSLALLDIGSLARYEARRGNRVATENRLQELSSRSPREGTIDQAVEWARCLATVAALLPNLELDRLIRFAEQFREHGRSVDVLDAFARSLRAEKNVAGLRELITASGFLDDEYTVLRQHAIALAFEAGIEIGIEDVETWNDPFSAVYRCLRSQNRAGPSTSLPPWSLLDRPEDTFSSRRPAITYFFKLAFYALLAGNLRGETKLIDWISQAPTPYIRDLLSRTNRFASETAAAARNKASVPFSKPYRHFEDAQRPHRWGGDREAREAAEIADGMQAALSEIASDLVYLQHEWTSLGIVSADDLQAVFSSPFSESWDWVASYLRFDRPFLPELTVTWLINDLEGSTDRRVDMFPAQAERYAKLASLSVMHNRGDEELERLLRKVFSNTIAYGSHKDMLIDSMLEIAEACHQGGMPGAEGWLLTLAPAVAHVDEYTDGDETRYFPKTLGEALAAVVPKRLPDYYLWLSGREEFFDARSVFHELIRVADLADPVLRAIARTGLDQGSLQVLRERAEAGDSVAVDLLRETIALLGNPPDSGEETAVQDVGTLSNWTKDNQPYAGDYPPPQIEGFLQAGNAKRPYETSELIKVWLDFWDHNGQGLPAYEAVRALADAGHDVRNGDVLADLARRFYGPAEAYRWLASANREEFGWSQYYTKKERAQARWAEIRDSYPDRWLQFIRDTITRNQVDQWNSVTAQNYVLRLVEYCIALGHTDPARQVAEKVLSTICELTSPAPLTSPAWMDSESAEMGGAA